MSAGAVARRYANALFQMGLTKGNLEEIMKDLDVVVHVFKDFPRIRKVYEDKKIYSVNKKKLFKNFFDGIIHYTTMTFLTVVIENYREEYLISMGAEFQRLYRKHHNIVEAKIITAVPLTEENIASLEKKLEEVTGREVALRSKQDPSLIGGSILSFGDRVINDSISYKLQKLEKKMRAENDR
ncbi:ATP synthase F1 subunit delta [Clostridia bacterium]|nr:ATP synthase F1 subunit delta [Clostridia bacterium]